MSPRFRLLSWLVGGFLLLQLADFLFTWLLLSGVSRADVYESNPVARGILDHAGWFGLAAFKLGITAVALLAGLLVAQRRRSAGLRLLAVMCLLMLGVNVYSGTLLATPAQSCISENRELAYERLLDQKFDLNREFNNHLRNLCIDLQTNKIDATEGLARLRELVVHYDPLLNRPPAGRLPSSMRIDELAAYLAYNIRSYSRQRSDGEPEVVAHLDRIADERSTDAPDNPLEVEHPILRPWWLRYRDAI